MRRFSSPNIAIDGSSLTLETAYAAVSPKVKFVISDEARKNISASRSVIDQWLKSGERIYGVTTGFGEFSNVTIPLEDIRQLQHNLIVSHAAGAGDPLPPEIVRVMMLLRANALAKGYSGIRTETVGLLLAMLNQDIVPVIPSQGSVGSSGDLVQLAHLVLTMMGKGSVWYKGKKTKSLSALTKARLRPVRLEAKEGLALINGIQMMTAFAVVASVEARELAMVADIAATMSVEALLGSDTAYDPRIHELRPYDGQRLVASNLRSLMAKSQLRKFHLHSDDRVQDAYSLRCIPQVHGASRDAIEYVSRATSIEINAATDNPLIFAETNEHLEGGNFHGQPIALAMDFLAIALSEFGNISERRIERLVNGSLSGLPRFLTEHGGLNSGLMIAQYTAASLVSENKVLAHPASVDSIPTSANQEDHNSMGSISAQKAYRILKNVKTILAIELLAAAQGIDFSHRRNGEVLRLGEGSQAAYEYIRSKVTHLSHDRVLHSDIQMMLAIVEDGSLIEAVRDKVSSLT